ncbi:MAG: caspase family protein [Bacteroidales bacterium]|nr:caspase family protein [Bacteroidales bacterium]
MKRIFLFYIFCLNLVAISLFAQEIRIIPPVGHTAQITDIDITDDGSMIVSASVDKTLILWDYTSGREIIKFSGTDYGATCCVFGDDQKCIYSGGWDGVIRKWDLISLKQVESWKAFSNGVNNITFLKGKNQLATIGKDGILKIWDLKNNSLIKEMKISDYPCDAIASSDKNNLIAVGDQGGNIIIVDSKSFNLLQKSKVHNSFVSSVSFSKNGKTLASASYDYFIKVFETKDFNLIFEFTDSYQMWKSLTISDDARKLCAISLNGMLYEWDLKTGMQFYGKSTGFQMGTALTYNSDASEICLGGSANAVSVFRSEKGAKIKSFSGYSSPVEAVDVEIDELLVASVHWDSRLRVFDMFKCQMANSVFIDSHILSDLFINPNKQEIIVSGFGADLKIFNLVSKSIYEILKSESGIKSLAFTDDLTNFAYASDSMSFVYQTAGVKKIFTTNHTADVMDICFSNSGDLFFSVGRDSVLTIVNVSNPFFRFKINLSSKAESVAISPDDKVIAVGLWNGEIALVNAETYTLIKYIKPHNWIVSDLDFNPINDYLLSASWDKRLVVTDWQNEVEVANFKGHTGNVTSAKYSSDGYYVVSGGWDNQIKILDSRNLEETCTIIPVDQDDYLILTPDLYYMGTSDAAKKVSFAKGLQTYSFEQFDLQYNRPDKVIESLPYADQDLVPIYQKAYEKRLQKSGFEQGFFDNNYTAPEVEILNLDKINLYTDVKETDLEFNLMDSVNYLDSYNVYVNGVSVFGSKGKSLKKQNLHFAGIKENIVLCEGMNHIEISVFSSTGVESLRRSLEIFYSSELKSKKNIYLISMAVAEYDNSEYNLRYTINDGRSIIETFGKLQPEYNLVVDSLFGKNCTRANFVSLKEKLKNTSVDDIVIIHFSGHGLLDEQGSFYFATHDVNFKNPSENGLEYELIEELIDGIPARNKLILIDACHSGELDKDIIKSASPIIPITEAAQNALAAKGVVIHNVPLSESSTELVNSFDLMQHYFADVRKGTGAVIISAATGSGFALEVSDLKHGVFTYVLLEGLREKKADLNKDGEISVNELREYVFDNVYVLSEGFQKATIRKDNLINDFIIYR